MPQPFLSGRTIPVPSAMQAPAHAYPVHQRGKNIEPYFYDYWSAHSAHVRTHLYYLPIFWTNYYVHHGFRPAPEIQQVVDCIDPAVPYFTIVQNDDGVLQRLGPNALVFGCGGVGHIPLPLLCDPHIVRSQKRDIFASFVGIIHSPSNNRTGVRTRMYTALEGDPVFQFWEAANNQQLFEIIMNRSVFALCPRGYGRSSFRMYEALQMGTIPVYIYDEPWLPYTDVLDWNRFAVLIHIDNIAQLPAILRSHTAADIARKQEAIREVYDEYFSMEGACKQVVRMLEQRSADMKA